jgi:hypothetical protein
VKSLSILNKFQLISAVSSLIWILIQILVQIRESSNYQSCSTFQLISPSILFQFIWSREDQLWSNANLVRFKGKQNKSEIYLFWLGPSCQGIFSLPTGPLADVAARWPTSLRLAPLLFSLSAARPTSQTIHLWISQSPFHLAQHRSPVWARRRRCSAPAAPTDCVSSPTRAASIPAPPHLSAATSPFAPSHPLLHL